MLRENGERTHPRQCFQTAGDASRDTSCQTEREANLLVCMPKTNAHYLLGDTSAITEAKLRKSLYAPVIVPENRLA